MSTVTHHRRSRIVRRRVGGCGGRRRRRADEVRGMTQVFLSYASQDVTIARRLAREWRERGVEVFEFTDPLRRAGFIIDEIERAIRAADVVVVLMSPAYLASAWCRRESRLAIQRENRIDGHLVYVLEVTTTSHNTAETLGTYSWVDARGTLTRLRLDEITAALPLDRRPTGEDVDFPAFRNREHELTKLLGALQTPGGKDLWVVVSPPLMGKT